MVPTCSIAEARNRFAEIVRELERFAQVEVTRRGKPVAVLVSVQEFERLRTGGTTFWDAYAAFRDTYELTKQGIDAEIFEGVRDRSPGRESMMIKPAFRACRWRIGAWARKSQGPGVP
jgi:antitoxin Phd